MTKLLNLILLCALSFLTVGSITVDKPTTGDECLVYIPETISPNGDGFNDWFLLEPTCEVKDYTLRIYTSSKRLVFESYTTEELWDGSESGSPLPQGHYSWELRLVKKENGDVINEKGKITLIR
ncbi:MAG: gliding motility-associated C-terminal domain-containing protein [Bacteroidota bacterium]